jgi:integrase
LKGKDADIHAYTLEEVHALVTAANNPTMEAAFIIAAFTGMRVEEIKGLRWEDYKNGILEVKRTVVHGVVDGPKSAATEAPVPVVGVVKEALAKHLKQNSGDGDGYIFHAEYDSQPQRSSRIFFDVMGSRIWKRLALSGTACTHSAEDWQPCCTQSTVSATALTLSKDLQTVRLVD